MSAEQIESNPDTMTALTAYGEEPAAARGDTGGAAAGPFRSSPPSMWPDWVEPQLLEAVEIAGRAERQHLAAELYREWFCPSVGRAGEVLRGGRPLAGLYRSAHAGSALRRSDADDELDVLRRHDVVGRDGWWRTWGETWTPPRNRPGSIRLLMTPRPDELATVVRVVTAALLDSEHPWLLACATDPRRLRRTGGVVLDLADVAHLPRATITELVPLLRPVAPPLCLPVATGIAAAEFPDNGMTFGEHRCHLVALGLRRQGGADDALAAIAEVFVRHGIAPEHPYLNR
jgi:hypothetical protein